MWRELAQTPPLREGHIGKIVVITKCLNLIFVSTLRYSPKKLCNPEGNSRDFRMVANMVDRNTTFENIRRPNARTPRAGLRFKTDLVNHRESQLGSVDS